MASNVHDEWASQVAQRQRMLLPVENSRVREIPWSRMLATQSIILAWRVPWTEEPGGVQSMWWQRVRHS